MTLLNPADVETTACRAITAARAYFNLDPLWHIRLDLNPLGSGTPAQVEIRSDYLQADITLDPMQHTSLAEVWENMGHEVAHLVLADLEPTRAQMEQDGDKWDARSRSYRRGVELAVTRLEKAFVRDRPYDVTEQPESVHAELVIDPDEPARARQAISCGVCQFWSRNCSPSSDKRLGACSRLRIGGRMLIVTCEVGRSDANLHTPEGFSCIFHQERQAEP